MGDNREMKSETKFKQTEIGLMPEDWEVKRLGDEIDLFYGKGLSSIKRVKGEFPVYGSNGVVGFHDEYLVKGPGVIIGRKGTVGAVKFSEKDFWPIDTTYFVKLKRSGDIRFWYYFMRTLSLNKMNSHSAVPGLNRKQVYELLKAIPRYEEQCAIAKILSGLDSKIGLNQQMNKTLEAIGQAIFKHWFVDFEFPNEEGKPYKSSGGEMVDNGELGKEIPKGWEVEGLLNFFSVIYGKNISTKDIMLNGKFPVFGGNGIIGYLNDYEYKEPVTLISCRGAASGKIIITSPFSTVTHNSLVLLPKNERLNSYFMFNLLKMMNIIQFVTGSAQPQITIENLRSLKIIIPSNETLDKINPLIKCLFLSRFQNETQIQTLSQIRDSLLPKLMSGKIRVPTGGN